jgi:DNA-binding CsgD family transcriptional regulator
VAEGRTNADCAQAMGKSEHVFKNALRVIYDKLGMGNRLELALWRAQQVPRITITGRVAPF